MSGKKKTSKHIEKAKYRVSGLRSIDHALDMGEGMTIEAYETAIAEAEQKIAAYNTASASINDLKKEAEAAEQSLADFSDRMLHLIAGRFGTKSPQYEKAGGKPRSSRRKKKTEAEPSSNDAA